MATIAYLVVAGGGGGGTGRGGGGGAGGLKSSGSAIMTGVLTVTVGASGPGAASSASKGSTGGDSVLGAITAHGGGGGGSASTLNGANGGSGGGASGSSTGSAGTGTGGEGNNGGSTTGTVSGASGGGAGGVGTNGSGSFNRPGGAGSASSISGASVTYATGGNGSPASGAGSSGAANKGDGGQGSDTGAGGNGSSGVVVVSFATGSIASFSQTGGTTTTSGGNTIITWTSSGTLTLDTTAIQPAPFVLQWTAYATTPALMLSPIIAKLSDGSPAAVSLGVSPTGSIKANTLNIVDAIGQVQTCDYVSTDIHGSRSYAIHTAVTITDGLATLFKGDIDETVIESLESPYDRDSTGAVSGSAVGARLWTIRAQGLSHRASRLLTGAFSAQARINISTVVSALAASLGISTSIATSPGTLLLPDSFLSEQETLAEAFTRLADLATALSGVVHFWKIDSVAGTITFIFQAVTNQTATSSLGVGGYPVKTGSIRVRTTREQFANSVVLKVDRYLKDGGTKQTDTKDGADIFLGTLTLTSPLASEPTVTVEGAAETVGVKDIDTGMDWYWALGSNVLTAGTTGAGSGDEIIIEYAAHDLRALTLSDSASVATVGLFQVPVLSEDSGNVASPLSQASAELARRNGLVQHVTLTAQTPSGVFSAGQLIAVALSGMGTTGQTTLTGYFYCRSIRTYDEDLRILWREFDLIRGPVLYRSSGFLRRLTR